MSAHDDGPSPQRGPTARPRRRWAGWLVGGAVLAAAAVAAVPRIVESMKVVSTDDAYVNGHVTFVAPRVAGQVARVLVDDNNRVRKGDLLVQLDKEPYQVQVDIAQAAVEAGAGRPRRRPGVGAGGRGPDAQPPVQARARDRGRGQPDRRAPLEGRGARVAEGDAGQGPGRLRPGQDDRRLGRACRARSSTSARKRLLVAQAQVEEALQGVYQVRVGLGLPPKPETGDDLAQVPADLDQTFSSVRQAQASLIQMAAAARRRWIRSTRRPSRWSPSSTSATRRATSTASTPSCSRTRPAVKQAEAKLAQAQRQSRPGRTEPALLRRRGRDRRRRHPPQRQPRQQRGRRPEPDGGPLADRDLGRRQLQGDAARRPADRPAGRPRRRHVRQPSSGSRAASPASRWAPARRWRCCRPRTPPATS